MPAAYSFLNVKASISGPGGTFSIGGSGIANAEEGILEEMLEDKGTMTIGAGGEGMHSLHAGKAGRITIRLLKTSPVNAQLSQLYALQSSDSTLWGQNTLTIHDSSMNDTITGAEAAFVRHPNVPQAKDGGILEWVFNCVRIDHTLGAGAPTGTV